MGLGKAWVSVKLSMPFGAWGKGHIIGIKYPLLSHRCYFRRDLSYSRGRQMGARGWICNERKEKWGESKGLEWAPGMPGQNWKVDLVEGGTWDSPPPWWEVVYIRSEGERRGMCLVFQSDCVARHHYWDCTIIFLFDSNLASTGSLWKTWWPGCWVWGSVCVQKTVT